MEKEADRKEDVLRNLPEFKRDRSGQTPSDQVNKQDEMTAEEKAQEVKEYNVRGIDEEEFEHYQSLEDGERDKLG